MSQVTCKNCGWVHFAVTREHAQADVDKFNAFYRDSSLEVQKSFGGEASISTYERCFRCGGSYLNMRPAIEGDCPNGCTIQPIISEVV